MAHVLMFFIFVLVAGCSFAPQPPQVSLTEDVEPVNFFNTKSNNLYTVITAEQSQKGWRKQFAYSINNRDPSPEFFYVIAHADQIIAYIRPPSISLAFSKLTSDLKRYGVTTPVEVFVTKHGQKPQIILECVKFSEESWLKE